MLLFRIKNYGLLTPSFPAESSPVGFSFSPSSFASSFASSFTSSFTSSFFFTWVSSCVPPASPFSFTMLSCGLSSAVGSLKPITSGSATKLNSLDSESESESIKGAATRLPASSGTSLPGISKISLDNNSANGAGGGSSDGNGVPVDSSSLIGDFVARAVPSISGVGFGVVSSP